MLEVLYTSYNRLEYTEASFQALLRNTDWSLVDALRIYDDGSEDGTREYLDAALRDAPVEATLSHVGRHSPVESMNLYLRATEADVFAKIDNDVCVPTGWLPVMLDVLERHPKVDLLGMEAGMTGCPGRDGEPWDGTYGYEPATNIGGVGLMRTRLFHKRGKMRADGLYGFTEYQHTHDPERGWVRPDLPVVLLDRLPFEPWVSYGQKYLAESWQRPWRKWSEQWMGWAWEWFVAEEVAA